MLPLAGKRIVVTRASHQAEELAGPLRELGSEVLLVPAIAIASPQDPEPLRKAVEHCYQYQWIIFTSVNAVEAFASLGNGGAFGAARLATVGEATRRACQQRGWPVSLTPSDYIAESLVAAFGKLNLQGSRILIPGAAATRDIVPTELRKQGASVHVVEAYRNIVPPELSAQLHQIVRHPYPDWMLFASPSAVVNVVQFVAAERLNQMQIATIGPATTAKALSLSIVVTVQATIHDVPGLVAALVPGL